MVDSTWVVEFKLLMDAFLGYLETEHSKDNPDYRFQYIYIDKLKDLYKRVENV